MPKTKTKPEKPPQVTTIPLLAAAYGDARFEKAERNDDWSRFSVRDSRHTRSALRRAARALADQGLVKLWTVQLPTRWDDEDGYSYRKTMAITGPDVEKAEGHRLGVTLLEAHRARQIEPPR